MKFDGIERRLVLGFILITVLDCQREEVSDFGSAVSRDALEIAADELRRPADAVRGRHHLDFESARQMSMGVASGMCCGFFNFETRCLLLMYE